MASNTHRICGETAPAELCAALTPWLPQCPAGAAPQLQHLPPAAQLLAPRPMPSAGKQGRRRSRLCSLADSGSPGLAWGREGFREPIRKSTRQCADPAQQRCSKPESDKTVLHVAITMGPRCPRLLQEGCYLVFAASLKINPSSGTTRPSFSANGDAHPDLPSGAPCTPEQWHRP